MERRYRIRLDELLDDAEVPDNLLRGVIPRLEAFLRPFVAALQTAEQKTNARQYVSGLLSDLKSKDAESIAYLHDRERQGLQKFIGQTQWNHGRLLGELTRHVATELGEGDGVLVFDPSAFPKKGPSRWACNDSGAGGSVRSRTARLASTWVTCRGGTTLWWIFGCTCPRNGPGGSGGARRPVCRRPFASARDTN